MKKDRPVRGAPLFEVRKSAVHGLGAFALRRIRKGTRLIEYLGDRVSHEEADRRYEDRVCEESHTFLFIVDPRTVIDAGVGGNDARFINHSCNPNCETTIERKRVFIEAARTIQPGEELSYDYQLGRSEDDPPNVDEIYACRCGHDNCRGTMLWPPKKPAPRAKARKRPRKSARSDTRAKNKRGTATANKRGTATANKRGTATAKKRGTATAKKRGTATAKKRNSAPARKRSTRRGSGEARRR